MYYKHRAKQFTCAFTSFPSQTLFARLDKLRSLAPHTAVKLCYQCLRSALHAACSVAILRRGCAMDFSTAFLAEESQCCAGKR